MNYKLGLPRVTLDNFRVNDDNNDTVLFLILAYLKSVVLKSVTLV